MRCKKCGRTQKISGHNTENWQHQQCGKCYSGHGNLRRSGKQLSYKTARKGDIKEYHKVRITEDNIELYCKLSQIIRDKPCKNKKLVLARQDMTFTSPVFP